MLRQHLHPRFERRRKLFPCDASASPTGCAVKTPWKTNDSASVCGHGGVNRESLRQDSLEKVAACSPNRLFPLLWVGYGEQGAVVVSEDEMEAFPAAVTDAEQREVLAAFNPRQESMSGLSRFFKSRVAERLEVHIKDDQMVDEDGMRRFFVADFGKVERREPCSCPDVDVPGALFGQHGLQGPCRGKLAGCGHPSIVNQSPPELMPRRFFQPRQVGLMLAVPRPVGLKGQHHG